MSVERDIRYDLIARLCPNATGAELKAVATEVGDNSTVLVGNADLSRLECSPSAHDEKWRPSVISWMRWRRLLGRVPNSLVQPCMRSTIRPRRVMRE